MIRNVEVMAQAHDLQFKREVSEAHVESFQTEP